MPPTALTPGSRFPLLHYSGLLLEEGTCAAAHVYELFKSNGWDTQWIFRYGSTQVSHYHSASHECMAVLSGSATIRFGVADTNDDLLENTHGSAFEAGGIEIRANMGDVFVIPAGVSHKTFDPTPADSSFKLLTPGDGHAVSADDVHAALSRIELSGFTMIGAYPNGGVWDFRASCEDESDRERAWAVPRPSRDPVFGDAREGLCGIW